MQPIVNRSDSCARMPLCVGGGWLLLGVAGSLDWVWDGTANPYRSYPSAEHLADGEAGPRHEVHAVLLGSSHPCAIPLNGATLPVPWAEVTPSCLRIQSRGAGWALSTPRVLAGFLDDGLEMARLPRQRHLFSKRCEPIPYVGCR
jgi:hypothetical protein